MRHACPSLMTLATMCICCVHAGCSNGGAQQTQPSGAPAPATRPAETRTAPETRPATMPATTQAASAPARPASTFDSRPPYPVELRLGSAEDKQPGWLKVLAFADKNVDASASGRFPEQNTIRVETQNVREIEIHTGYLPLAENRRVTLLIDKQGIELVGRRRYVRLERRPTGQWVVVPSPQR